jgi:hypothetical protein
VWCLNEIFSDNSDKAKLITALISVIAAVIVVCLTHALASRRSRIALRAEKMEELYSAASEFGELGYKLIHERANPLENDQKSSASYYGAHKKVEMLASIYFKSILNDINEMHLLTLLTKDDGSEPMLAFPEKLQKHIGIQQSVKNAISNKVRKIV